MPLKGRTHYGNTLNGNMGKKVSRRGALLRWKSLGNYQKGRGRLDKGLGWP